MLVDINVWRNGILTVYLADPTLLLQCSTSSWYMYLDTVLIISIPVFGFNRNFANLTFGARKQKQSRFNAHPIKVGKSCIATWDGLEPPVEWITTNLLFMVQAHGSRMKRRENEFQWNFFKMENSTSHACLEREKRCFTSTPRKVVTIRPAGGILWSGRSWSPNRDLSSLCVVGLG